MSSGQVGSTGWAVAPEVGGVEDESSRASDASSDAGIPSSWSMAGNAVVESIEEGSARRTVTRVGDVVEDESSRAGDASADLMIPDGGR